MAEQQNEELSPQAGSKKKLIIIIAAACVLLTTVIASYFLFVATDNETGAEQIGQEAAEGENSETESTTYVAMPRPFVFNVQDGKRDRLVQIRVQLMVRSNADSLLVRKHIPLLEGILVRVFGTATIAQLRSPIGKGELRSYALAALNEGTLKFENKALIHAVLFTGFVLQ